MKGLMVKDLELMKANIRILGLVYMIALLILFTSGIDTSFFVMYVATVSSIISLNTMSFDICRNGLTYLMTLPVTRKQYVLEKYLFSFCFGMITWGMAAFLGGVIQIAFHGEQDLANWLMGCVPGIFITILFAAICIPVELKFRQENVRLVIIGIWFSIFIAWYAVEQLLDLVMDRSVTEALLQNMDRHAGLWGLLLIFFVAGAAVVSYRISLRIMRKKEL